MHVVVGAERNNFEVRRNVVDYTASYAVDVKVVRIHESHAAQEENSSADFAQRLIRRRKMHPHN